MKSMIRIFMASVTMLAFFSLNSEVNAQQSPGVIYRSTAQGEVVHTVVKQSGCECGCGGTTGCVSSGLSCALVVTPSGKIGVSKPPVPFPVTPPSLECDPNCVTTHFYEGEYPRDITIDIPTKVKECVETITFKRVSFNVCGCNVAVCVPCATICTESEQCIRTQTQVKATFKHRAKLDSSGNSVYDVWVENVPSLPSAPSRLVLWVKEL